MKSTSTRNISFFILFSVDFTEFDKTSEDTHFEKAEELQHPIISIVEFRFLFVTLYVTNRT